MDSSQLELKEKQSKKKQRKEKSEFRADMLTPDVENHSDAAGIFIDGHKNFRDILAGGQTIERKAGWAAEELAEQRYNANQTLSGSKERMYRSDNIGRRNDQVNDVVYFDENQNEIGGAQFKFYGDAKSTAEELSKPQYKNTDKVAPAEQIAEVKREAARLADYHDNQAVKANESGNIDKYKAHKEKAANFRDTAEKAKASENVTLKESKQTVKSKVNTAFSTGKEVAKVSHKAGKASAKKAAGITVALSGAKNLNAVYKRDKEIMDALIDTTKDTVKASAASYAKTTTTVVVQSGINQMQKKATNKVASEVLKKVGSGSGPAMLVQATWETGKSLIRYFDGEIDEKELIVELGEKGTGIVASTAGAAVGGTVGFVAGASLGAAIGTMILPGIGTAIGVSLGAAAGEFIGATVGGMVAYMLGTQLYRMGMNLINKYEIDSMRYTRIKEMCGYAHLLMEQEQAYLEQEIEKHFAERHAMFKEYFTDMNKAILHNSTEGITKSIDQIAEAFGKTLQFKTFDEFNDFMLDDSTTLKI